MKPVWLALVLLAVFVDVSWDDTRGRLIETDLAASEQQLRLKLIEPRMRQFDTQGLLVESLSSPLAEDFGDISPTTLTQPRFALPQSQWVGGSSIAIIEGRITRLEGSVEAFNSDTDQRISSPVMITQNGVLRAEQGVVATGPSFEATAEVAELNNADQTLRLTSEVNSRLWPSD